MSGLAGVLLVLNVAQTWLREICRVTWRDGPGARSDERMAEAATRVAPVECRLDGVNPTSACMPTREG